METGVDASDPDPAQALNKPKAFFIARKLILEYF